MRSPLQQIDLVDRYGFAIAVERDHDTKADRGFCGSDRDHEDRKDLAGVLTNSTKHLPVPCESDEVDVDSIQNQLDRHEDDDDIAPGENSSNTDNEKNGA